MLLAKALGARSLLVKSDSLLVTWQVTGEYQVKDPQLTSYLRYCTILKVLFSTFDLVHVPREQISRVRVAKWGGSCGSACGPLNKMRGRLLISTR